MKPAALSAPLACAAALAFAAWAGPVADVVPASGPLAPATVGQLLLVDAARVGNRIVAVGDRGYIVYSDDDGAHWSRAKAPAAPLLTAVDFVDAKNGWAVGHDEVILATRDGGETWTQQFSAPSEDRPFLDVAFLDAAHGIAIGAYGAYFETADGGRTWSARKILRDDKHLNGIARLGGGRLFIVGEEGTMLFSPDEGKTWTPLESPYKGSLFGVLPTADGALVAFGLRGRIYRSADEGRSWSQVDNASLAGLMGGARLANGTLVVAGAAGTVLVSRDNGRSFVPLATGVTHTYATAVAGSAGHILLFGEAGAREVELPANPPPAGKP